MKHESLKQFEVETDTKRVLRRAREMINEGWCQKITLIELDDGRLFRCAGRALVDAGNELGLESFEARQFLTASIGEPWCIPIWNDRDGREKAEVLAAFDKAMRLA